MTKVFATALVAVVLLAPTSAGAGERAVDAAIGAASGGLLFGPAGLVAGGIIGYAAGPSIARSWGLHRHYYYGPRYYRYYARCYYYHCYPY